MNCPDSHMMDRLNRKVRTLQFLFVGTITTLAGAAMLGFARLRSESRGVDTGRQD